MIKNTLIATFGALSLIVGNTISLSGEASKEEITEISQTKTRLEEFLQTAVERDH